MKGKRYYAWKGNSKREMLYQRCCRILKYGKEGSVLVVFESGQMEIATPRALRRIK